MGSLGGKTKTSGTSTQTATTTPTAPGWLQGPFQDYYKQAGGLLNQGFTGGGASGASDLQNQTYAAAGGLLSGRGPSGYNPSGYNASGYNASGVDVGKLADADLSKYMNPYTKDVIDASLGDLERQRQIAINQNNSGPMSAWGGSAQGITNAETNAGAMREAGLLSSTLRNQGFLNAQQGAQFDINNRFGADQFNANAMNTMGQFNSNAMNAAGQFNSGAMNDAGQFNANAMNGADANTRANLGLLAGLGADQRNTNMAGDPQTQQAEWLARMQSLLGLNPNAFIGNNATSNGATTGTQTNNPGLLQIMGTGAQVASMFSDRRLKRDVIALGPDEYGQPWYEYAYVWDEPGVRHVGVMADEAPAHAVSTHESGYLMVDYSKLAGAL